MAPHAIESAINSENDNDDELAETGSLRLDAPADTYRLSLRWLTEVPGTDVCFARWILQSDRPSRLPDVG
jgi:hypothetical protein